MSIATEIARIKKATSEIRAKYVELGIAQTTDAIEDLANASDYLENRGAVSATVAEGSTYTIPEGYHNGSGTVTGIAPGASATVDTWETPDMVESTEEGYGIASADDEFDGHEAWRAFDGKKDTYWAAPSDGDPGNEVHLAYEFDPPRDISGLRITYPSGEAASIAPTHFVVSMRADDGSDVASFESADMTESDGVFELLDEADGFWESVASIDITCVPADGQETIGIAEVEFRTRETVSKYSLQAKVVNPTSRRQSITPDNGYYGLSSVTVNPIPLTYKDVSVVSADAEDVLTGKVFVDSSGQVIAGTMPAIGVVDHTIDGLTVTSITIPSGYTQGGTIALDNSIENALSEI